jgi:cell division initiation protein
MASFGVWGHRFFSYSGLACHFVLAEFCGPELGRYGIETGISTIREVMTSMKITPLDVEQKQFRIRFRGFDVREVDSFLEQLAHQFTALISDNEDQKKEIQRLVGEIREYRDREDAFKEAMINSQKALDDMRSNAEKEAELIIAEAEMKAEKILSTTHNRLTQLHEDISELKRQRMQLEVELGTILEAHRKLLEMSTEAMDSEEMSEEKLKYLNRT